MQTQPNDKPPVILDIRNEEIGQQLREKIASKFSTSTFLAGFGAAILGIEVTLMWQAGEVPGLVGFSIAAAVTSLALFVAAIVKLDALTMPKLFWLATKPNRGGHFKDAAKYAYLQQSELWALSNAMRFYWNYLMLPAMVSLGASLGLLLIPVTVAGQNDSLRTTTAVATLIAGLLSSAYVLAVHLRAKCKFDRLLRRLSD